ncbi:hypothetical protein U9M48_026363 [Paspalum notatum var. saurae]|uniref:Disease resistance R13L4/SHOC-2-like LRR domain-containing protein n=1 Tax=Paspalum notatum var. saurae TaxID=547442 RepID=A0AAQ3TSJ7_PASNO
MKSLHTLDEVDIAPRETVQDIKGLTQLRKLGVGNISKDNCRELCSAIAAFSRLESLSLQSSSSGSLEGCLDGDGVFSPPKDLKSLKLWGRLVELSRWTQGLQNLEKLKLQGTRLKDHAAAIQVLNQLPKLTILCLGLRSFDEGTELHFLEGSLRNLLALELELYKGIKEVKIGEGAMPNLELMLVSGRVVVEG